MGQEPLQSYCGTQGPHFPPLPACHPALRMFTPCLPIWVLSPAFQVGPLDRLGLACLGVWEGSEGPPNRQRVQEHSGDREEGQGRNSPFSYGDQTRPRSAGSTAHPAPLLSTVNTWRLGLQPLLRSVSARLGQRACSHVLEPTTPSPVLRLPPACALRSPCVAKCKSSSPQGLVPESPKIP